MIVHHALPVACALLLGTAPTQEAGGAAAPSQREPRVVFESASGELERLPLSELDIDDLEHLPAALLRFEDLERPELSTEGLQRAHVELATGGRVYGTLDGGEGEFLDLRLPSLTRLRLSIEEIASLRVPERFPPTWSEPVGPADEGDRLYRTLGAGLDRIDGTVESFSAEGVSMETPIGSKTFPWREVAALFVEVFAEDGGAEEGAGGGARVVVDLIDGGRLPYRFLRLSEAGLDLRTPAGRPLRLPLGLVSEVLIEGRGVRFLSDVEPSRAEPTAPFGDDLGMVWPVRRDLSTSGAPLRAGGRLWTRGLGVHAPSRLEYALDGEWKRLRGRVAIDDEVVPLPAQGSVIFRVAGDGRVLWESRVMRGGDAPLEMPAIDLSGVVELVLEVDSADELHVGDRADWLRVVLVR